MEWNQRKHHLSVLSATEHEGEDAAYLEVNLELNYHSYQCIYIFPHQANEENALEVVTHGNEHYWCRFCQQQSASNSVCTALTNDQEFNAVLDEKIDDYRELMYWNKTEGYVYEELEKEEFQASVYDFILTYHQHSDCFLAGVALGDEDSIHAPYLLSHIAYHLSEDGTFEFDLSKVLVSHYEGDVQDETGILTHIMCDCGYEYDPTRSRKGRPPTPCSMFQDNPHFKEWMWDTVIQREGFVEHVKDCLEKGTVENLIQAKSNNIVSLQRYKKHKL